MNALRISDMSEGELVHDCFENTHPVLGFLAGAIFPITMLPVVEGDFCWNLIQE